MKTRPIYFIVGLIAMLPASLSNAYLAAQEFQPLFNGKDLTGWVHVNTPEETWKVQDGMLVCSGRPIGELRTETMYQNFELELEWRHMVPRGNAGVFVWADDITSRGVPFHRSIEVQVLENEYGNNASHTTHGDIFPIHGATMTPINGRGGSRAFPTENRSLPSPQWNHYRIVCNDGAISLAVNGKVVTQGTDASPRKGYICLESEGGVVHYRNIRIKPLPDTPIKEEHIAIENRGFVSLYSGLDLRGWVVPEASRDAWQVKDWVLACNAKNQASLQSAEDWRPTGFVLDWKFSKESTGLRVELPGTVVVVPASDDSPYSSAVEKTGSWNRLIIEVAGNTSTLQINGKPFPLAAMKGQGKIQLVAEGPIEFANIYARSATD